MFQVGDVPLGNVFCSVAPTQADQAAAQQVNSAVAQRTQVQLAENQTKTADNIAATEASKQAALAAEQAAAQAAAANGGAVKPGKNAASNTLAQAAVEKALAALPLSVWLVIAGGIVVVLVVSVYTAYKLGRNRRAAGSA